MISRSVSGCGRKQAGSGRNEVTSSSSLGSLTLVGVPPAGEVIVARLSRLQSGLAGSLGTWAVTRKPDVQPGGTFTGAARMLQVSTGPACPQAHGPKVVIGAVMPSVSVTVMGPE